MHRIVLKDVSKFFGKGIAREVSELKVKENYCRVAALDSVSLQIDEGQRVGIIGKNGAGKSTLLHIIAGLTAQSSGSVDVVGKVTSIMTLGVGLREELSGRENIYIDGEIQGKSRSEVDLVIDQIIDFSELGEFIDYPVKTYSTGMKARLGFSMISCLDPEILIIDEALSVGDAAFSAKASAKIREICAKGKIVIIVSHGMGAIRDICDRCLWIDNGRILMDGTPDVVTAAYIDSVRGEDEISELREFSSKIDASLSRPGYEISEISLADETGASSGFQVFAGKKLLVNIIATQIRSTSSSALKVKIVRLDDQIMFDQVFFVSEYLISEMKAGLQIEFESLMLGASVYRIDVNLFESVDGMEDVCATKSKLFEVVFNSPPRGGKPMLVYPLHIESILES